ncbi:DUF998 domain-containing protein [Microbacterium sp. p3-SID336]|uniref:DUF998 domain-containing protein n=1 Tax=Microbacterium sp. p3-SID336 TaxID=2916212 RepID=UPI0021A77229|nr:DUF998 domain-containing protein [Microbacterium sp. p3-SID336]MCT1478642.1 DUF998 domain-containing protein [Microbacterium sp. p3-SID336]
MNSAPRLAHSDTRALARSTRPLLLAGAFAGPLFYASALVQMLTRPGFDLRIHPLSQLSTGDLGWIQVLTFVLVGLGVICLAIGHRRIVTDGLGRTAIPVLVAITGAGFIAAGVFPQDPANGFPLGTPDGPTAEPTWHALVHMGAAIVGFTALAVAAVIALIRAIRERRAAAAIGNGVVAIALLAPVVPDIASIQVAVTGLFAFGWCTATAIALLGSPRVSR